jgi:hypothetical protein
MDSERRYIYPDETRWKLVHKFDEYKEIIVDGMKKARNTFGLFARFLCLIRIVLRDMRACNLPTEIQEEIRRIMSCSFNLLREMAHDSGLKTPAMPSEEEEESTDKPEEAFAKKVIEQVKGLSVVVVPEEEIKFGTYREVPTKLVVDSIPQIPNKEMREAIETAVVDIRFPTRKKGESDETARFKVKQTGYKGGVARLFLKIYVYLIVLRVIPPPEWLSEEELKAISIRLVERILWAELPLTDKDIVCGPQVTNIWVVAAELGVDADGVEKLKIWDIVHYMNCRDIDQNHALLTKHALFFTPEGFLSCCNGIIHAAGRARTMFGVDTFRYWKHVYHTNKILHREVKQVAEDKGVSFSTPTYNRVVQIGIYYLVLIRRMVGKRDQNLKIAKIWSCARQLGQTRTRTPGDFILELTTQYPQFSFRKNQNIEDIARWIIGKFTVAAFRSLKQKFGVHPDWGYHETCEEPLIITPNVSTVSPEQYGAIEEIIKQLHDRDVEQKYPSTV